MSMHQIFRLKNIEITNITHILMYLHVIFSFIPNMIKIGKEKNGKNIYNDRFFIFLYVNNWYKQSKSQANQCGDLC